MKHGDIVLVTYPFTDLSGEKLRPAFVVLPEDDIGDMICAFITSVGPPDGEYEIGLKKGEGGLHLDSVLRLRKLMTVHKSIVKGRIGSIEGKTLENIQAKIKDLFDF